MSVPILRVLAVAATALAVLAAAASPAAALADAQQPAAGATPPPISAGMQPCVSSDLSLREAPIAARTPSPGTPAPDAIYALKNRGAAACRISGGVGIRLFDANGNTIALRVAPRNAMAMLLTLAPGDEASFTVSFGSPAPARCATSARIEVYLAPQLAPLGAPTSLQACGGATVTVSNLQLGLPPNAAHALSPADTARFT